MELKSFNKIDVNRWELEIAVSAEDFGKEVDKVYNRQKNKINVPGFRKGKAPRKFIEKYYGEGVFYEDAVNAIYPYAIEDAAKEAGLELVDDHIDFEMVKMSKEEGLDFKVKVTVMPEVTVENYKGIEVDKVENADLTDEDIDKEIEFVRNKNSRLVTVEDGVSKIGDIVNIDFEGSVDGTAFDGGSAKDVDLELGSNQFIPGFETQIVDHKTGEKFDINTTFPKDYHVPTLAGKEAVFKIKLNKIQRKDLPEFDDEFVKDISEFENVNDYKDDLKKKVAERKKSEAENKLKNETTEKFIELVKSDIPDALVKAKIQDLVKDFEYKLRMQGLNIKDYIKYTGTSQEKLEETFRPQALNHVKLDLGLRKVAELENISVTDDEITQEFEELAKVYKMKPEQVKRFVSEEDVKKDLLKTKAMNLIQENRKIK